MLSSQIEASVKLVAQPVGSTELRFLSLPVWMAQQEPEDDDVAHQ